MPDKIISIYRLLLLYYCFGYDTQIGERGGRDELMAQNGLYARMVKQQTGDDKTIAFAVPA